MNKDHIRNTMLSLTEDALKHAKSNYAYFLQSARIDRDSAVEAGDAANAEQASDLAEAFDQPIHSNEDKIAKLEQVNFGKKSVIEEGAVVRLSGRYFVIAVSTAQFVCEDESFMGISTDAPIYAPMQGLRVGDTFTFREHQFEIEQLF